MSQPHSAGLCDCCPDDEEELGTDEDYETASDIWDRTLMLLRQRAERDRRAESRERMTP